jgi:N-formylglutamate amidohydrolase
MFSAKRELSSVPLTGLVPIKTFDGLPLYRDGEVPSSNEVAIRSGQ